MVPQLRLGSFKNMCKKYQTQSTLSHISNRILIWPIFEKVIYADCHETKSIESFITWEESQGGGRTLDKKILRSIRSINWSRQKRSLGL